MAAGCNLKSNRNRFSGGKRPNRFQNFFEKQTYILAKRHLYNYHIRRRAVARCLDQDERRLVLEIGCGVAPVAENVQGVVYTDLSFTAVNYLKQQEGRAHCVVADGTNLPFKEHVFSHVVTSEVLEHIEDDDAVLKEASRSLRSSGRFIITFPHRKIYFAVDDRYVAHFRRYEIGEMEAKLHGCGFNIIEIGKVLGPLEKITMWTVTGLLTFHKQFAVKRRGGKGGVKAFDSAFLEMALSVFKWVNKYYGGLARLDAEIMPMTLATVLVIKSQLPD